MRAISVRLSDAYEALQVYAEPIASHALQVYQSVSATGPTCRLLDWVESSRVVTPRLVSQRTSNWRALREWHEGPSHVSCIAYSPDGSRIASGSNDGNVRVWDAQTGKQLSVMEGCNSSVYSMMSGIKLAWNIDGAFLPHKQIKLVC
jgi:WD40 repeat protein